jgi:hypothetical protein
MVFIAVVNGAIRQLGYRKFLGELIALQSFSDKHHRNLEAFPLTFGGEFRKLE